MAAEEKDIILLTIKDLLNLKKELRAEQGKKRKKPEEVDKIDILKQDYDLRLSRLKEIDKDEFKKQLEELSYNFLNNFYIILKDCQFLIALEVLAKQELNVRRIKAAQPRVLSERRLAKKAKEAKAKEAILSPENIVFKFLQINHIIEVTLGEEKLVIDPENESSISLAVSAIIQYFGFHNMKQARNINLLLNILDPECNKKDEELITLLLSAGKKKNSLSFPYLICFEQPGKKGQFILKANFDKAMLYRFYHIIFHVIIYSITTDYNINIDRGTIGLLRGILFSFDKELADGAEKKDVTKNVMHGSNQEDFSPGKVYELASNQKPIGHLLLKEGMSLEAKQTLIDAKVLAKQIIAFMNSQEEAIIILGVPEEKEAHGDGCLRPNLATGFSFEECRAKIEELKEYISKNIGIINSGQKFSFEEAVSAVIVSLNNIRQEEDAVSLEGKYCLLLRVRGQNYLSYLKLDSAPGSQSQVIAVYMRDYCKDTIESTPAHDNKILVHFLRTELTKKRHSPEIKNLYKANRLFGYFADSFRARADDQDRKKVISIYYLAKIYKRMLDDGSEGNYFMLYDNLLQLLEEFCQCDRPEDKINRLIKELYDDITSFAVPSELTLIELKQALREAAYISPKLTTNIVVDDSALGSRADGADSIAMRVG